MAKVTGLGGVFLRARDPKTLTAWYAEHLGLPVTEWGGVQFVWDECAAPEGHGSTAWSLFPADTDYFGDGKQAVMLNYRVDDAATVTVGVQARDTVSVTAAVSDSVTMDKFTEPLIETPQSINVVPLFVMQDQGISTLRDTVRNVPGRYVFSGTTIVSPGYTRRFLNFSAQSPLPRSLLTTSPSARIRNECL